MNSNHKLNSNFNSWSKFYVKIPTFLKASRVHTIFAYPRRIAGCWASDMKMSSMRCTSIDRKYHLVWHSSSFNLVKCVVIRAPSSQNTKIIANDIKTRADRATWLGRSKLSFSKSVTKRSKNERIQINEISKIDLLNYFTQKYEKNWCYWQKWPKKDAENYELINGIEIAD